MRRRSCRPRPRACWRCRARGTLRPMLQLLLALLCFFARPDERVTWTGSVELPGALKLDFSVELGKDSGTISIPMQGAKDLPLDGVSVSDKELKFALEK